MKIDFTKDVSMKMISLLLILQMFIGIGLGMEISFPSDNYDKKAAEEVERVFAGLSDAVEVTGEKPKRMKLIERMRDYKVPGLGIVLIEKGQIRWARYLGVKEDGLANKVDSSTRFMVKSLSKPVTAFAALRLVDKNLLKLDTPLKTYLKNWTIPSNQFTAQSEPTLRQLLSHSAGFTVFGVPSYKANEPLPSLIEALNGTAPAKGNPVLIDYIPGAKTRYSGGGYSVLQQILGDVSGQEFPAIMQDLVLRPVGMRESLFSIRMSPSITPLAAVGHQNNGKPIEGKWEILVQMAAGGLIATPVDIAKFDIEVMRAWQGKSKLLSKKTAREMLTKQKDNWGLGFEVKDEGNGIYFSHTGSGDGFRAIMVGFPATGQGAIILSNGSSGSELRYELLRSLAREYKWGGFRVIERQAVKLDAERMANLAGIYEYSDKSVTEVFMRDGNLFAKWRDLEPVRLYAASSTLFFTDTNEEFEFTEDSSKQPTGLKWRGSFGEFNANRKK